MLSVRAAIHGRRSVRAFDPQRDVPIETVRRILQSASRAPNGSNIQPWSVHVLKGPARDAFCQDIRSAFLAGVADERDYAYYMATWREPYLSRRRATGWGLYTQIGVGKGDRDGTRAHQARNYDFFDAPVGLILTTPRDMGTGAWLDLGAFIQTLLLAARGEGLETCAIASFCNYPNRIRGLLGLPHDEVIVTGIAIGHANEAAAINGFQPERLPVDEFAVFHERLPMQEAAE